MADAPFGARSHAASTVQEPKLKLAVFSEAVGRSRVVQVVFIAVRSAGRSLPPEVIYCHQVSPVDKRPQRAPGSGQCTSSGYS